MFVNIGSKAVDVSTISHVENNGFFRGSRVFFQDGNSLDSNETLQVLVDRINDALERQARLAHSEPVVEDTKDTPNSGPAFDRATLLRMLLETTK